MRVPDAAPSSAARGWASCPTGGRPLPVFRAPWRTLSDTPTTRRRPCPERCGIPAVTIGEDRRPRSGHVAFERPVFRARPLNDTDRAGPGAASTAGRWRSTPCTASPPSRQRLPDLPRLPLLHTPHRQRRRPGRVALQGTLPAPLPPGPRPAGRPDRARRPLPARRWLPARPRGLLLDRRPAGADRRGVRLGRPLTVRGMLRRHRQRLARRPLPVEVLFLFIANMAWNSGMNPATPCGCWRTATRLPAIIDSPLHLRRRVLLPDRGLRRPRPARHDLSGAMEPISLLDRPIGHGPGDPIREPCVTPGRTCVRSRTGPDDLRARSGYRPRPPRRRAALSRWSSGYLVAPSA